VVAVVVAAADLVRLRVVVAVAEVVLSSLLRGISSGPGPFRPMVVQEALAEQLRMPVVVAVVVAGLL
jgi:hypothetical protein